MLVFPNYAKKYDSKNRLRPLGSAIARTITRTRRHIIKKAQCEKRSFSFFAIPMSPFSRRDYSRQVDSPPFFLRDGRASETRAGVKITPREKRRHAAGRFFSPGVIFTRARVSLALLSLRKNGGLLVV